MSHFTVLVIGDDVDGQMARYDENAHVEPYWLADGKPQDDWQVQGWIRKGLLPENPSAAQILTQFVAQDDGEEYDIRDGELYRKSTYNPDSKWDYYVLGGRWRGFFTLKPNVSTGADALLTSGVREEFPDPAASQVEEYDGTQMARLGTPGTGEWMDIRDGKGTAKNYSGTADQARKGDIDFEMMRVMAGAEAQATFDKFAAATAGIKSPGTWSDFFKKATGDLYDKATAGGLTTKEEREEFGRLRDEARAAWAKEPFRVAMREADVALFMDDEHTFYCLDAPDPRKAFIERAVDAAFSTFAVVKDGKWLAKGDMGWFGLSSNEKGDDTWNAQVRRLVESLPDDTLLSVLDCHI